MERNQKASSPTGCGGATRWHAERRNNVLFSYLNTNLVGRGFNLFTSYLMLFSTSRYLHPTLCYFKFGHDSLSFFSGSFTLSGGFNVSTTTTAINHVSQQWANLGPYVSAFKKKKKKLGFKWTCAFGSPARANGVLLPVSASLVSHIFWLWGKYVTASRNPVEPADESNARCFH